MTIIEAVFVYGPDPGALELEALDQVRKVYGIRRMSIKQAAHTMTVEYDASRLSSDDVAALLRDAGIAVVRPPVRIEHPAAPAAEVP